jgi:hypothetical protein
MKTYNKKTENKIQNMTLTEGYFNNNSSAVSTNRNIVCVEI